MGLNGRSTLTPINLACGIIAFPQSGPPLSRSMPEPHLELDPAPSIAS